MDKGTINREHVLEFIDTHAHLTFDELYADIEGVIGRSIEAGVVGWVTIGTDREHSDKVVELIKGRENMWGAIGYHPHYAKDVTSDDIEHLRKNCGCKKIVAVGEIGLDYYYGFSDRDSQRDVFIKQLDIAVEHGLPVVIHSREAFDETVEILDGYIDKLKGVVVHCYSGDAEQAKKLLDRGIHISFTGIVTFKNADQTREAAKVVPLDRMMIETDCPYISPAPMRNQRPCEPALMVHTANKIAEIKGIDIQTFAAEVVATSRKFFGIS
jgi:TatD DNase family protein